MPASTLDPINAALRTSLTKTSSNSETSLNNQLIGCTKKTLLADIEYEPAPRGSYQHQLSDLRSKYIVLTGSDCCNQNLTKKSPSQESALNGDSLPKAKHELFSLANVSLGWPSKKEWGVGAGMVNMGNTCYLNSTLQALFHVPSLVNWLLADKQQGSTCEDSGNHCIICAMRKTMFDSQQRHVSSIRPYLIYNKLRVLCRHMIPGRQEDAHEFLRYLVEAMEMAYLNRFKNQGMFDSRTKETTPLNQILGGYLRSAVRCLDCGHVSTTFQHFQDLMLDVRKAQTLDEALDGYFSREKLDDESYQCESCQKKVQATKQFCLERAPMVLCIQLKRFSVSNNKITKNLQFKQRLDLTKYARQRPTLPYVYTLVALVTHMGPTVNCGHYTAVAQAPCGNFYQFDDSMVRPISHQAVFSTNAYIMLYELERAPALPNGTVAKGKMAAKTTAATAAAKTAPLTADRCNSDSTTNNQQQRNSFHEGSSAVCSSSSNSRVYGPELPPSKLPRLSPRQNGDASTNGALNHAAAETTVPESSSSSNRLNAVPVAAASTSSSNLFGDSPLKSSKENKPMILPQSKVIKDEKTAKQTTFQFKNATNNASCNGISGTSNAPFAKAAKTVSAKTPSASAKEEETKCFETNNKSDVKNKKMEVKQSHNETTTRLVPYESDNDSSDDVIGDQKRHVQQENVDEKIHEKIHVKNQEKIYEKNHEKINNKINEKIHEKSHEKMHEKTHEKGKNNEKPKIHEAVVGSAKASNGEWKVTYEGGGGADNNSNKNSSTTLNHLMKMSHAGYSGANVSTWNGTKSQISREVENESRQERKRPSSNNDDYELDKGRVKHPKMSNGMGKSNPGYNPIQEYQNVRNYSVTSNTSFRHFYNNNKHRYRNRKNFHKNGNFHNKSYRFKH